MQNLLLFLIRYGHLLTFLLLEFICFYLIIQFNQGQREIFLYSSNLLGGSVYEQYNEFEQYLDLKGINDSLLNEHAILINNLSSSQYGTPSEGDSLDLDLFHVIPAFIINNSITGKRNMLTLNKGAQDGIQKSMGLLHPKGVAGIIRKTSKNYSSVISILNTQIKISAKIKRNGYFGSLSWDGQHPFKMQLMSIPKHADVILGDTVTTSQYSTIFPDNVPIGVVSNIDQLPGRGDFLLTVELFIDMSNIQHGYVISPKARQEIMELQKDEE